MQVTKKARSKLHRERDEARVNPEVGVGIWDWHIYQRGLTWRTGAGWDGDGRSRLG